MLNSTQIEILNLTKDTDLTAEKDTLIESFIKLLKLRTGKEFVRDQNSNIYLITAAFVDKLIEYKLEYLSFLADLNSFFDTNKFTGFAGGDYYGLRSSLLALSFFEDCKIAVVKEGIVNIIVLLKEDIAVDKIKQTVAKTIHQYLAIGIKTYEKEDDKEAIYQEVEASSGQAIKYAFYLAKVRKFNFKITYFLDYEEDNIEYDMVAVVSSAINNIYNNHYGQIGKNLNIQDFYSISLAIAGLGRISLTVDEVDDKEQVINSYQDQDIAIATSEIFTLNKLEVIGGAS